MLAFRFDHLIGGGYKCRIGAHRGSLQPTQARCFQRPVLADER